MRTGAALWRPALAACPCSFLSGQARQNRCRSSDLGRRPSSPPPLAQKLQRPFCRGTRPWKVPRETPPQPSRRPSRRPSHPRGSRRPRGQLGAGAVPGLLGRRSIRSAARTAPHLGSAAAVVSAPTVHAAVWTSNIATLINSVCAESGGPPSRASQSPTVGSAAKPCRVRRKLLGAHLADGSRGSPAEKPGEALSTAAAGGALCLHGQRLPLRAAAAPASPAQIDADAAPQTTGWRRVQQPPGQLTPASSLEDGPPVWLPPQDQSATPLPRSRRGPSSAGSRSKEKAPPRAGNDRPALTGACCCVSGVVGRVRLLGGEIERQRSAP